VPDNALRELGSSPREPHSSSFTAGLKPSQFNSLTDEKCSFEANAREAQPAGMSNRQVAPIATRALRLDAGELFEIQGGQGVALECHEGAVWITQSNDPLDIVLTADESFALAKSGLAIVSACGGPAAIAVRVE
jgi:Protein of unknown function (DUF2917)